MEPGVKPENIMSKRNFYLSVITLLVLLLSACTGGGATLESTQPSASVPLIEAEVPRVSVQEAKAALESGTGVIVDVRSTEAFESSHIVGAISVPLADIEQDTDSLPLDREQWIITYCT
jgi:3-mercaptopyruvate sulfurtransferase SseA